MSHGNPSFLCYLSISLPTQATTFDGNYIPFYVPKVGQNGYFNVVLNQPNVLELKFIFFESSAVTHVNYFPCAMGQALSWSPPTTEPIPEPAGDSTSAPKFPPPSGWGGRCPSVSLDFNDDDIQTGQYIADDLVSKYGVVISAEGNFGGHTPGGAARIFDTAAPEGDIALGTPNFKCNPASVGGGSLGGKETRGSGRGSRGEPRQVFENCKRFGKALIIQESDEGRDPTETPNDHRYGGKITFEFVRPVILRQVVMINSNYPKLTVSYSTATPFIGALALLHVL